MLLQSYGEDVEADEDTHAESADLCLDHLIGLYLCGRLFQALHDFLAEERADHLNCWYETKENADDTIGYLADIDRAWRAADDDSAATGVQCRYALMVSSINGLGTTLPPGLIVGLASKGVWGATRAYAYAQRVPYERDRARAFFGLAPFLAVQPLRAIFRFVWSLTDEEDDDLTRLLSPYPQLRERLLRQMIAYAQGKAAVWPTFSLAEVRSSEGLHEAIAAGLLALVPTLALPLLRSAIILAAALHRSNQREMVFDRAVVRLAALAGPEEALDSARQHCSEEQRARLLVQCSGDLPEPARARHFLSALCGARSHGFLLARVELLALLAPGLPVTGYDHLLTNDAPFPGAADEPRFHPTARAAVIEEALAVASSIEEGRWRGRALGAVAPLLPTEAATSVYAAAIEALRHEESDFSRWWELQRFLPLLPDDLLPSALALIVSIQSEDQRLSALRELVPSFRGQLAADLFASAGTISSLLRRVEIIARLPTASEENMAALLTTVQREPDTYTRSRLLAELGPKLSDTLLRHALETIWQEGDESAQALDVAALGPYLSQPLIRLVLDHAQPKARWQSIKTQLIIAVVPQLARLGSVAEALTLLRQYGPAHGSRTADAVEEMAPYIPASLLEEALDIGRGMGSRRDEQLRVIDALAPYLPVPLLLDVLRDARTLDDADAQTAALASITDFLTRIQATDLAVSVASLITDAVRRAQLLAAMVASAPPAQQPPALRAALTFADQMEDDAQRASAISLLLEHLPDDQRATQTAVILRSVQQIHDLRRQAEILRDAASRVPESERALVVGEGVRLALASKPHPPRTELTKNERRWLTLVRRVQRLPGIGAPLRVLFTTWGLERTDRIDSLAVLLSLLLPAERAPLLKSALNVAYRIPQTKLRAHALARLVPLCSEDEIVARTYEAVGAIRGLSETAERTRLLGVLAQSLPEQHRIHAYSEVLGLNDGEDNPQHRWLATHFQRGSLPDRPRLIDVGVRLLVRQVDRLPRVRFPQFQPIFEESPSPNLFVVTGALGLVDDHHANDRAYALTLLLDHSRVSDRAMILREAWSAAKESAHQYQKAEAMARLIPYFDESDRLDKIQEAIQIAGDCDRLPQHQVRVLLALADHVEGELRHALISQSLRVALENGAKSVIDYNLLETVAPVLSIDELLTSLATTQSSENGTWQDVAARLLAPHFARLGCIDRALTVARGIRDISQQATALAGLLDYLNRDRVDELVRLIEQLPDDPRKDLRRELLNPSGQRQRALALTLMRVAELGDPDRALEHGRRSLAATGWWPFLLTHVLPLIAEEDRPPLVREAFTGACLLTDAETRAQAFRGLVRYLVGLDPAALRDLWSPVLHELAKRTRKELLTDLAALAPIIGVLGGTAALVTTGEAIGQVRRWWA